MAAMFIGWFLVIGDMPPQLIGPFPTQDSCLKVRKVTLVGTAYRKESENK